MLDKLTEMLKKLRWVIVAIVIIINAAVIVTYSKLPETITTPVELGAQYMKMLSGSFAVPSTTRIDTDLEEKIETFVEKFPTQPLVTRASCKKTQVRLYFFAEQPPLTVYSSIEVEVNKDLVKPAVPLGKDLFYFLDGTCFITSMDGNATLTVEKGLTPALVFLMIFDLLTWVLLILNGIIPLPPVSAPDY